MREGVRAVWREKAFSAYEALFELWASGGRHLCKRIEQALQASGHSVWFDGEQITHGSDWRERITQGIRDSNGAISCLSKHSVRNPGVPLDELSIAIGIRGGNIKTILLESEKEVRPRLRLSHPMAGYEQVEDLL